MTSNKGTFVISLDTELGWGCFDTVGIDKHRKAYRETRNTIKRLCHLFDQYQIPITWAIVMHLLDDCEGHEEMNSPEFSWVDSWYRETPCSTGVKKEFWYAPEILGKIRSCEVEHEIGLHGYSHLILGDPGCTRDAAEAELRQAVTIAEEHGIAPETFVFPRNQIGHLDLLEEYGIRNYRGKDDRWYEQISFHSLRKPFRFADEATMWTPPVVTPNKKDGLLELPGSQILRPFHGSWRWTPPKSQLIRAKKGLERAAETGQVFHLWFHPFNIAIDLDRHLQLLENIVAYADKLRTQERLDVNPIKHVSPKK